MFCPLFVTCLLNMSARRDLTLKEKYEFLKLYDELSPMSQTAAAKKLGIPQPILSKLLKNRYELETSLEGNDQPTRKQKRTGKDEDVENVLKVWFTSVREKDARVNGPLLMQKAKKMSKRLGTDFKVTRGWFYR